MDPIFQSSNNKTPFHAANTSDVRDGVRRKLVTTPPPPTATTPLNASVEADTTTANASFTNGTAEWDVPASKLFGAGDEGGFSTTGILLLILLFITIALVAIYYSSKNYKWQLLREKG